MTHREYTFKDAPATQTRNDLADVIAQDAVMDSNCLTLCPRCGNLILIRAFDNYRDRYTGEPRRAVQSYDIEIIGCSCSGFSPLEKLRLARETRRVHNLDRKPINV